MAPWINESASIDNGTANSSSNDGMPPAATSDLFEPIAIVGMACRWPGDLESGKDIETPSALWDFLQEKKNAYSEFPASRLNIDSWYHPVINRPGSFYTRGGAFLKADPREFDPTFFGINPQEATSLDPAQRKFLEVVYEAFESSGTPLENISGSKTGCFVGNFNYDHQLMQYRDTEYPEAYGITGGGIALLSNRVSYVFNLQGPSLTLDTACSSSMYALHLACSAIHSKECSAAIVGGSNLILSPECQVFSSSLGAISKSSRCHTFDAAADGYARADGIGALYVKSLRQAVLDQDPIRAIIRGTAINANGKTAGITHPDPDGQEKAIRRAYERAGVDPAFTTYFECHGTGTPVGDPLEVEAVARVFAGTKSLERPLLIGSVKSNMGHCESASGIAGIMKTVLALEQSVIPPIFSLQKLNPNVDLKSGNLIIVQESTAWPIEPVRRASVNSFGYGGANAHTILEAIESLAPGHAGVRAKAIMPTIVHQGSEFPEQAKTSRRQYFLFPFSAHDSRTLKANVDALQAVVERWDMVDIAYTLSCRRSIFSTRAFVIAEAGNAREALRSDHLVMHKALGSQKLKLGFVFTGQGAQWPQMGLELMSSFPTYLKSIRSMDEVLRSIPGGPTWGIEDSLRTIPTMSQIYRAELSQVIVTAVQVALVDLLVSWDVQPSVNVGHSSGEIAAVYASGRTTAAEAIITAYARGRAVSRNKTKGAMLAVGASADAMSEYLIKVHAIIVACYNSPNSVTLTGSHEDIVTLKGLLDADGIFCRVLATNGNAYHSSHMKKLGTGYEHDLNELLSFISSVLGHTTLPPATFVSSVTGEIYGKRLVDARYWRTNLESPVLFTQALSSLIQACPVDQLLEIGPHSALSGPIRQLSKSAEYESFPEYIPTLIRNGNGTENLLTTAGTLFARGYKINLRQVNTVESLDPRTNTILDCKIGDVIVDLPKYQWQYSDQYYFENRWTREWRLRTHPRHDILGSRSPGGNWKEPSWRNVLKCKDLPWLKDHKIASDVVFPTSAYLSMAMEAATQMVEINQTDPSSIDKYELYNINLEAALIIPENGGTEILLSLRSTKLNSKDYYASKYDFTITSVVRFDNKDIFTEHATGQIAVVLGVNEQEYSTKLLEPPVARKNIRSSQWYDAFEKVGLNYGPTFRGLSNIQVRSGSYLAQSNVNMLPTINVTSHESRYVIHPAALDSTLQLAILAGHDGRASKCETAFLPVGIEALTLWPSSEIEPLALATAHADLSRPLEFATNIALVSANGRQIMTGSNIALVASETLKKLAVKASSPFTRMVWRPDFTLLIAPSLQRLYPTTYSVRGSGELSVLEKLALLQTIQFKTNYPKFFAEGSTVPHLQRFLNWITEKVDLAARGVFKDGLKSAKYSVEERDAEIARLEATLMEKNGPETRLMCHMYRNLPAIYRAEITGIQVAIQDRLLDDMYAYMRLYHEGTIALKDLVVLLSHKNPQLKILEVGGGTGSATRVVLPALRGNTQYRRYNSYTFTDVGTAFLANAQESFKEYEGVVYAQFDMQANVTEQGFDSDYDLIIASNVIHATTNIRNTLINIRDLLRPGGKLVLFEFVEPRLSWNMILGTFSDFWNGNLDPNFPRTEGPFLTRSIWKEVLPQSGFGGVDMILDHFAQEGEAAIIMATAVEPNLTVQGSLPPKVITIVHRGIPSLFITNFSHYLQLSGAKTKLIPLSYLGKPENARLIFLIEADGPFFPTVTIDEWEHFKNLVMTSYSALYVTRGGLLDGSNPEFAMISGIACAIHTEDQSSRLVTVDIDKDQGVQEQDFENLMRLEEKAAAYCAGDDFEYRSKSGVVHISRLESDDASNAIQKTVANISQIQTSIPLAQLRQWPMIVLDKKIGGSMTVCFKQDRSLGMGMKEDEVEVEVMAVDLGVKVTEIPTVSNRSFAGLVTKIGSAVTSFRPGDRIFGLSQSPLGTLVTAKEAFCIQMRKGDTFEEMATIPAAFCAAIYGLIDLASIEKGQSVLIQSPTSRIGSAACQIASICGAEVYVTAEPDEKHVIQARLGIKDDHMFYPSNGIHPEMVPYQTNGSGFDIILSNAEGEQIHQYCQWIAPHGRFVDLGRTEVWKNGWLSMSMFRQNATFSSFDLTSLIKARPTVVARIMQVINGMLRDGSIKPLPSRTFSVSNAETAFGESITTGKEGVILTFDPASDSINVEKTSHQLFFEPEASYILVGCLGGLGRSFAEWMVSRGAKKLTFLSRTGAAGEEAQDFLSKLQSMAIAVEVIRGDVASMEDVERAVKSCTGPIKGIVQAALTLHDSFFNEMSIDAFRSTMEPRVKGTFNLHSAVQDLKLDFFLMWSSWTTIFGSASQSNYMAANSYMDAFANYRRSLGLPATSIGLGQILDVGVVSHHPQFQENLLRMGLYGNTEDDFLRYCETSILASSTELRELESGIANGGHLLAGVEPAGLLEKDKKYRIKDMSWYRDPRLSILVQAVKHHALEGASAGSGIRNDGDDDEDEAPVSRIHKKLARLLYVAREDIDAGQPIKAYGIDSMVAAELRNWLFSTFGVDISLLKLLHPAMTAKKLAGEVSDTAREEIGHTLGERLTVG